MPPTRRSDRAPGGKSKVERQKAKGKSESRKERRWARPQESSVSVPNSACTMALQIGLIGAGRIGRKHAETLAHRVRGAELAMVADADAEAARAAGAGRWTTEPGELLADPAI